MLVPDAIEDLSERFIPSHGLGDSDRKHPLFGISKVDGCCRIGSLPQVLAIDHGPIRIPTDAIAAGFVNHRTARSRFLPLVLGDPTDLTPFGIAGQDLAMRHDSLVLALGPPIPSVDFPKRHPQTSVVGVVVCLVRDRRIHGIRARHLVTVRAMDGPEHWLGPRAKQIACHQFAVAHHIDPIRLLDGLELGVGNPLEGKAQGEQKHGEKLVLHGTYKPFQEEWKTDRTSI